MRYTQSQIRELLSISVDAFRTWRDAIPALAQHKGHAPSFTPGDVVAMAIVAELVRDFGMRVGSVGDRFDQLLWTDHMLHGMSKLFCQLAMGDKHKYDHAYSAPCIRKQVAEISQCNNLVHRRAHILAAKSRSASPKA